MSVFRILLLLMLAVVLVYTGVVGFAYGWNLLPVFFGEIAALTWQGQFNLDFMCLLALTGLWIAWRHHFSPGGILLGVLGFFGGIVVLASYLLYAISDAKGDVKVMLLGRTRANLS